MAKLELINLNKTYDPKTIPVKDLSLTVADNEFLTLVGPSGCGKSTILRLISGLEQPTRGEVRIGDQPVTNVGAGDRNIAMVFQSYALYPHMNVFDNMASSLKLRKINTSEIKQRVEDTAKLLGLEKLLDRKPGKLSGGQRQRVALGRALVRNPDVFLLDEPLSNLDALLREQVRADLKQIFAKQNAPVVYVTHDQVEAMTLSSRVAVLNDGILQQLDAPPNIYAHPANRFVAGFIGSPQMNLFTLNCEGDRALLGDVKIPLPGGFAPPPEIDLGIRPEHVSIASSSDHAAESTGETNNSVKVQGRIFLVENLGMSNLLSVNVQGANNSEHIIRALLPVEQTWDGEEITLSLAIDKLHWFHAQTGEAIGSV
ncbi:carbohydrate ABC transporter ATP-binding protein, CUT1 family [Thalassoporum mexicanum PCC 7367]|uniref:ABC transporter ATP-binding protein n=1 Tax=Thalassoporum mexicanum TaxID=3457544 RepID=UPI00029FA50E|nr:ABC transporter ATP-binding protein [Pseudanabaena sp. PCC 7367]AFY70463.1 carbohydrate ABC transporter ATP-binding protein, CUT1 family [Pseudanabaena sp. PCC 7367]